MTSSPQLSEGGNAASGHAGGVRASQVCRALAWCLRHSGHGVHISPVISLSGLPPSTLPRSNQSPLRLHRTSVCRSAHGPSLTQSSQPVWEVGKRLPLRGRESVAKLRDLGEMALPELWLSPGSPETSWKAMRCRLKLTFFESQVFLLHHVILSF